MGYQSTFKRYELKFLLTTEQQKSIEAAMTSHMSADQYGLTTIRNIYYDTDDFRLIRASIERPVYKEKLRLRSYQQIKAGDPVFVELKKKYNHVVYKRRLAMEEDNALRWLNQADRPPAKTQISSEIDYFLQFYKTLKPKVFLSYDRVAWCCKDGSDFRVTFDRNLQFRSDGLSLALPPGGTSLLADDSVLMELKVFGGIPLWMANALTENRLYKTSYSKYGNAYRILLEKGEIIHAR